MPNIIFKTFPGLSLLTQSLSIVRPRIKKAYFATAKIEEKEVTSTTETEAEIYTVVSGDTLSKIASKKGTTVAAIVESDATITNANKHLISVGQQITLPTQVSTTETKKKITFTKSKGGKLGETLYVIVETEDFRGYSVSINVEQGKDKCLEEPYKALMLKNDQGNYSTLVTTTVGGMSQTEFTNKDDFQDMAIFKIAIDHSDTTKKKAWQDALEEATDKKTQLCLLIDAHSPEGQTEMHINYDGNSEAGQINGENVTNRWLDAKDQWFELKKKDCCTNDITSSELKEIFTNASDQRINELRDNFNDAFEKFSIDTCQRKSHFFAQIREEVGNNINTFSENLNYTVQSLKDTFSYFRNNPDEAELYGRSDDHPADQEAIGNRAYANRLGNGNIESGDGWNYRGKGYIQLTGRSNYESVNDEILEKYQNSNIDIIESPDDILSSKGALLSAMGYWTLNGLNNLADNGSEDSHVNAITAVINLYTESYSERREHFETASNTFKLDECKNL